MRAGGMSVWQILLPGAFVGADPRRTEFDGCSTRSRRKREDHSEKVYAKAFGRESSPLGQEARPALGCAQDGTDGQSVLTASSAKRKGHGARDPVTAFVYDKNGRFSERVDAARGQALRRVLVAQSGPGFAHGPRAGKIQLLFAVDLPHAGACGRCLRQRDFGVVLGASGPYLRHGTGRTFGFPLAHPIRTPPEPSAACVSPWSFWRLLCRCGHSAPGDPDYGRHWNGGGLWVLPFRGDFKANRNCWPRSGVGGCLGSGPSCHPWFQSRCSCTRRTAK